MEAITRLECQNNLSPCILVAVEAIAKGLKDQVVIIHDLIIHGFGTQIQPCRLKGFTVSVVVRCLDLVRGEVESAVLKVWHLGVFNLLNPSDN